jgi:hypothetical protein
MGAEMKRNYTHRVVTAIATTFQPSVGSLCSNHYTKGAAERAVRRYVAQSNGRQTDAHFQIEVITKDELKEVSE